MKKIAKIKSSESKNIRLQDNYRIIVSKHPSSITKLNLHGCFDTGTNKSVITEGVGAE